METTQMSQQESDKLILQEMGLAEDDSTTNDEEETETVKLQQEEETETETEDEEENNEIEEVTSKPKKGIAKVLHQRNEARKEAEQAKSQVQQLQEKLDKLTEDGDYGNEEYVQTLVDKRIAEKEEIIDFFEDNSELRQYKKDIVNYSKELGIPLERATKLYLAENNPSLLLDKEDLNKTKSKIFNPPMQTSKDLTKGKFDYSLKEFEELAKKGEITF